MPASAYTDAGAVAQALSLPPDTTLAAQAAAGAVSISISANKVANGPGLFPGMYIALDQYNLGAREVVQVNGPVTGTGPYDVPVTALQYQHGEGVPVKEVSKLQELVGPASRMWDDATSTDPGMFAQQTTTETVKAHMVDGRLWTTVSGRNVTSISSLNWQYTFADPQNVLDPNQCTTKDYEIWAWPPQVLPAEDKGVLLNITYTSGFSPIPEDIARACTAIAARFSKESESGFSDVIGSPEFGILQYKKALPQDVQLIAAKWKRWM